MKIPTYSLQNNEQFYNTQLNQTLQTGLSNNGWTLPPQSTSTISSLSTDMPDGTMWYDTDAGSFKVKIDGSVKTVTVS